MNRWLICGVIALMMLCGFSFLPPVIYLALGMIFFFVGVSEFQDSAGQPGSVARTPAEAIMSRPVTPIPPMKQPTSATAEVQLPERKMPANLPADLKCPSCGASIKPTERKCAYCGSTLQPLFELPEPAKLAALEIGQGLQVKKKKKGSCSYRVRGRLLYTELWQASRGPTVPWTPTGNYFAGFALEPQAYLLNWQERFYLFEARRALTDMDINRDFMPHARQFAQSNQTARVIFYLDGKRWQIVDIGRFAIEFEDGQGLHLRRGAIGRFIHAHSDKNALAVEDFQSGGSGGQDTLWLGWQINEGDIKF